MRKSKNEDKAIKGAGSSDVRYSAFKTTQAPPPVTASDDHGKSVSLRLIFKMGMGCPFFF